MTYILRDDYSEGCHPRILSALAQINDQPTTPYGADIYSDEARALICKQMGTTDTPIHFVSGGTTANLIIHSALLQSHQSVIAPATGHINANETGAIEAVGNKILTIETDDGKLSADLIENFLENNVRYPHTPRPKLVYISNVTETGTVYNLEELTAISNLCRTKQLYLMVDGARLPAAIASDHCDITMQDIAKLVDVFWLGGTKTGLLFGEAIAFPNAALAEDFEFHLKQRGALLAKGAALGLQFKELMKDNFYLELATHANQMAQKLANGIRNAGYELQSEPQANMIFPILPNTMIEKLKQEFAFYVWKKMDADHSMARLITSWATEEATIDLFLESLSEK